MSGPRKRFISNFRQRFKLKSTNIIGKRSRFIVHGSKAETVETYLETVKLNNEEKSALFN